MIIVLYVGIFNYIKTNGCSVPAVARAVGESKVTCRRGRRRGGGGGDEDDVRPGAWRARGTGAAAASIRWPSLPDICRDDTNMPRRANSADSGIFRGGGDGGRCKASLAAKRRRSGSAGRSMAVGDDKILYTIRSL